MGIYFVLILSTFSVSQTLDEIRNGLIERDATLGVLKFDMSYKNTIVSDPSLKARGGLGYFHIIMTNDDKIRIEFKQMDKSLKIVTLDSEHRTLVLPGSEDEDLQYTGYGLRQRKFASPLAVPPSELIHYGAWSVLRYVESASVRLTTSSQHNQMHLINIEWEADDPSPAKSKRKGTFTISPDLSYAVIKSEEFRKPAESFEWKLIKSIEGSDFDKNLKKALPCKVHRQLYAYYDDGRYQLLEDNTVVFESWTINPKLDKNTFHVPFPTGALVNDKIRGGPSYKQHEITDSTIENDLQKARKAIKELESTGNLNTDQSMSFVAYMYPIMGVAILLFIYTQVRKFQKRCTAKRSV